MSRYTQHITGSASRRALIAPTKTLAKKRPQYRSVCDLGSSQVRAELLPTVPVDEVWGIGAASAVKLAKIGVQTAADLASLDPDYATALMTVTGGRTIPLTEQCS